MLTATLIGFFIKIITMQYLQQNNRANEAAKVLRVNPYFIKDYQLGARNFSQKKLKSIVAYLRETDLKSKGIDNPSTDQGDLMKELVFKIMH
jgi:DNA polymerase-3 subunit delta